MTNKKLIELYNGLLGITNLKGVKFSYAVAKNINIIEREVDVLRTTTKESDDFKKYEAERIELCIKHAKKDPNGEPMIAGKQYLMEDFVAFNVEFEALKETNKVLLGIRKAQFDDYNKLLEVENSIELFKINISEIPEDVTTAQMGVLYPIITE